jgi:hypothetical protein
MDDFFINCKQRFIIIDKDKWKYLKEGGEYEGVKFEHKSLLDSITKMVQFSEENNGFSCAITKSMIGTRKSFWFPVLFYESDIGWIRVRLELIKCLNCGWKGNGANPSLSDLYDAVENKFEEMKIVQQLKCLNCPKCNSKLKRDAIWLKGE